jgi:hypothetical protein
LWRETRKSTARKGTHDLVLGSISDEPLGVREGDVRRGGAVTYERKYEQKVSVNSTGRAERRGKQARTLVVGDDLDPVVLPDTDTRVGRAEVDSNSCRERKEQQRSASFPAAEALRRRDEIMEEDAPFPAAAI